MRHSGDRGLLCFNRLGAKWSRFMGSHEALPAGAFNCCVGVILERVRGDISATTSTGGLQSDFLFRCYSAPRSDLQRPQRGAAANRVLIRAVASFAEPLPASASTRAVRCTWLKSTSCPTNALKLCAFSAASASKRLTATEPYYNKVKHSHTSWGYDCVQRLLICRLQE